MFKERIVNYIKLSIFNKRDYKIDIIIKNAKNQSFWLNIRARRIFKSNLLRKSNFFPAFPFKKNIFGGCY